MLSWTMGSEIFRVNAELTAGWRVIWNPCALGSQPARGKLVSVAPHIKAIATNLSAPCTWSCVRGKPYCVDAADARVSPATQMTLKGEWYEANCKTLLYRKSKSHTSSLAGSLVATGGVYFGDYLPLLASLAGEEGVVHGFEPNPGSFRLAKATAQANRLARVRLYPNCLSADGEASLKLCVRSPGGSPLGGLSTGFGKREDHQCGQFAEASCVSLDATLPWQHRRVGLLLFDLQGAEQEALQGARRLITRWRPLIAIEQPAETLPRAWPWLSALGYNRTAPDCSSKSSRYGYVGLMFYAAE